MAFCGNCGSEQANDVRFCVSCGKETGNVQATSGAETNIQQRSSIRGLKKGMGKYLIIGVSGVAVVAIVLAVVLAPKPLSLTKAKAEKALMQPSDFSFDMSVAASPSSVMDKKAWIVFSAGDSDCSEDTEISSIVRDRGKLLASEDYKDEDSDIYFDEDIVEFESSKYPSKIIGLINDGYENSSCDYDSDNVETSFSEFGTSKEQLGIGPESSAYFAEVSDWSEEGWEFLSSKGATVVVADGKYLVIIRLTTYSNKLTISESNEVLHQALEKIFK